MLNIDTTHNKPAVATHTDREEEFYISLIKDKPILDRDEIYRLLARWQDHHDIAARDRVVECNLRFVVSIASWYAKRNTSLSITDLIQVGNIGLVHACDKFNIKTGNQFLTYATWWVRSYIQRELKRLLSPFTGIRDFDFYTLPKITDDLNSPVGEYDYTLADVLPDDSELADDMLTIGESRQKILNILRPLNEPMDVAIIADRIMTNDPTSLESIGSQYGTRREMVRQRELDIRYALEHGLRREYEVAA